jgi:hypothetical protein
MMHIVIMMCLDDDVSTDSSGLSSSQPRRRSLRPEDAPQESFLLFLCDVLSFWTIVFYTPPAEKAALELPRVLTSVIGSSAVDSDLEEQGMELTGASSE